MQRRGEELGMTIEQLPKLDCVLVSHAHYDHYDMRAFSVYPDKTVPMILKPGTTLAAEVAGFRRLIELDLWQTWQLGDLEITATPARHSAPENTYVVRGRSGTVFFGADTMLTPELEEVAKRFPKLDLALLPVNGLKVRPLFNHKVVMDPADAARLCVWLGPRVAVPIHYAFNAGRWGDRLLLKHKGSAQEFARLAAQSAPQTVVRVLSPGQTMTLGPS